LTDEYGVTCIENIDIESPGDLREVFESLEDQRFEPYEGGAKPANDEAGGAGDSFFKLLDARAIRNPLLPHSS
jgi:hypothetical protein